VGISIGLDPLGVTPLIALGIVDEPTRVGVVGCPTVSSLTLSAADAQAVRLMRIAPKGVEWLDDPAARTALHG
jgi:hypothetical protein